MNRSRCPALALAAVLSMTATLTWADWNQGLDAFNRRDFATAEAELSKVVAENPSFAGGHYMLGLVADARGQTDQAFEHFRQAIQLEPNPAWLLALARATANTDRAEDAIQLITRQIDGGAESAEADLALSLLLSALGRYDEAMAASVRAFDLEPANYRTRLGAVELAVQVAMDDYQPRSRELARQAAGIAVRLATESANASSFLHAGETLVLSGEYDAASSWLEQAVAERPDFPQPLYWSGRALRHLGHNDEAAHRLQRALDSPASVELGEHIAAELAAIAEQRLDLDEAVRYLEQAGDRERAQQVGRLHAELGSFFEERSSLAADVSSVTAKAEELAKAGDRGGAEHAELEASSLRGQLSLLDESLESVRTALAAEHGTVDGQLLAQRVHQGRASGPQRPQPLALGLRPLASEELLIITRSDRPSAGDESHEPPQLRAILGQGREVPLPLLAEEMRARVAAAIASVEVEQHFHNPSTTTIEAVYVFPLPQDAAVDGFVMTIGERTIRGIIREREEAEQIYREARGRGHVASLLTQERPNVFTQRVANIAAGQAVDVTLTYTSTVPFRDGAFELSLPTVVGPRFNPPPSAATGADGVPPMPATSYLAGGEDGGSGAPTLALTVDIDAGMPVAVVDSPTHAIQVERDGDSRCRVTLAAGATRPDRDLVLRWLVAGDRIESAFMRHEDERGGFFTLMITPPTAPTATLRVPGEHIIVLDCSGSMQGLPLELEKRAVHRLLDRLGPDDTFQVIRFSGTASALERRPLAATPAAVRAAHDAVDRLESQGGTMMIEGVKAALDLPATPGRTRFVSLLTDGFIGNEAEVLAAVHERLGASRIFSFGVGSAPNRYLVERLAVMGRGAVAYVGLDGATTDAAVDAFVERIASPVLSDVSIDWQGMQVSEVSPSRLPDLFLGRPIVITGRYHGRVGSGAVLHGRLGDRTFQAAVDLARSPGDAGPALAAVWARMRIADLADRSLWEDDVDRLSEEIRDLAVRFGVMCQYTAFLAVDASTASSGDPGVTVTQPLQLPAGVCPDVAVATREP